MNGYREGLWRLADPKISLTSVASMYLGVAVAAIEGPLSWGWLAITGAAFFCMEVAKNAWGDVYDYDSGTDLAVAPEDRTAFSGGKRVMVDNLLTRRQTWGIAIGFGAAGVVLGAVIVLFREPAAIWIGIAGLVLGWSYHGPPLQFAYRGLGELDVVICYGPLIALATYLVQTHRLSADVLWLSLPLGLYIAAFLWVNEFPDYFADLRCGKKNLVARLGRQRASRVLPLIYLAAIVLTLCLPAVGLPSLVVLGLLALPAATYASVVVWRRPETFHRHDPAQPAALIAFLLYSVGAGSGVLIGGG
ncbi:MAG: prenyltransferase [Woeseiaceae bacterium]|nr:prenyltransferase [Woeseiaceae bacterium]